MFPRRFVALVAAGIAVLPAALVTGCGGSTTTAPYVPPTTQKPDTLPTPTGPAQTIIVGDFNARALDFQGKHYVYQVFVPRTYTASKPWPVIMAFHGSGSRGSDNQAQLNESLGPIVKAQVATFPAIVIFPQVPAATRESDFVPAGFAELDQVTKELNVDPTRVYLTGWSFGGYLAYDMAYTNPTRFAALVPLGALFDQIIIPNFASYSAAANYATIAQRLKGIPTRVYQGYNDIYTKVADARVVVSALQAAGVNVTYTEFPNGTHDVTGLVYWDDTFFTWLFAQHR